jgi:hypothetical protein
VDSSALADPVDSETVNETTSKGDAWIQKSSPVEIITGTPFEGDAWIQNSYQHLLTKKKSTKTESVPTGIRHRNTFQRRRMDWKALTALLNEKKSMKIESELTGKSSPKNFQRGRVDWETLGAPVESEKVNENGVCTGWKIITETTLKGVTWIRKRSQPLLTQKKSTKMKSVLTGKSLSKNLPR